MTRAQAGDWDYDRHGPGYTVYRRPEPRIAAMVLDALGPARTIVNVGAGAGSYEPEDRYVIAVEPSAIMRSQRPAQLAPAIDAVAEHIPLDDGAVDAAMAMVTIHQWPDGQRGLREMRRVARGPVVVLTFDGDALNRFWLAEYSPELVAAERRRMPSIASIRAALGGSSEVRVVPVPADCADGFTEAYYARPEIFLDPAARAAQSAWGFISPSEQEEAVSRLRADLQSGAWDARFGHLRSTAAFEGSLRLVIAHPAS
ncbi:MAG: methyltransferase domain-containing protein [Actinomycetota bacterium]